MATSGSEKTAGRSRLTSNRRFASGRRPGWLRPREVSLSHTSASRSSLRPSRRPGDRPPTGVSSCRSTTTATSCKPRPTNYTRSIFTASESCPTRAAEAPGMANSDTVRDDTRKTPPQGDPQRLGEPPPNSQNAQSRCSRAVRQPEERCGSAIDRAIPHADGNSGERKSKIGGRRLRFGEKHSRIMPPEQPDTLADRGPRPSAGQPQSRARSRQPVRPRIEPPSGDRHGDLSRSLAKPGCNPKLFHGVGHSPTIAR